MATTSASYSHFLMMALRQLLNDDQVFLVATVQIKVRQEMFWDTNTCNCDTQILRRSNLNSGAFYTFREGLEIFWTKK